MNKEILNYLARVDTYYQSVQAETKLTIAQTYDNRKKQLNLKVNPYLQYLIIFIKYLCPLLL